MSIRQGSSVIAQGTIIDNTPISGSTNAVSSGGVFDVLAALYPVGSLYIGTQSTCPLATIIPGSTWELVSSGRALWTGNGTNANTTIAAGLPNIKTTGTRIHTWFDNAASGSDGPVYRGSVANYSLTTGGGYNYSGPGYFDASRSSSIYGNSTTVQPPAYVVNVWRRTA